MSNFKIEPSDTDTDEFVVVTYQDAIDIDSNHIQVEASRRRCTTAQLKQEIDDIAAHISSLQTQIADKQALLDQTQSLVTKIILVNNPTPTQVTTNQLGA